MKLDILKERLEKDCKSNRHPLRNTFQSKMRKIETEKRDVTIIGITGSRGKSTVAYLIHKYLISLGKKSILYSSICVDSAPSFINKNVSCEMPIKDEDMLLDIIKQVESYEAEYLVLEVSERAIEKGLVEDVPFDIKIITNLNPYHNKDFYEPEKYVDIKKSFFGYSDDDSINIIGLTSSTMVNLLNDFLEICKGKVILFGSRYISKITGFDENKIDYLLTEMNDSLEGLDINLHFKNRNHSYKTNLFLSHNALNITCVIAALSSLRCYDEDKFKTFIKNITIPGRDTIIKTNNRTIIVGMSIMPMLEELYKYKLSKNLKIKVIIGSPGLGYKSWIKEYSDVVYKKERTHARKKAMEYLRKYADYVCITENDSASTPFEEISNELKNYIDGYIDYDIVLDRQKAIEKVIKESKENDVIYIAGRGNRIVLCNGKENVKYVNDLKVAFDEINKKGWVIR